MKCPFCSSDNTHVKDSRSTEEGAAIRRRRICHDCEGRFTTFERIQLRELTVMKGSGRREPFDRDKLFRSFKLCLQKRPVDMDHIERVVTSIVRRLESSGDAEVTSEKIGAMAMETLVNMDPVGYVRYASVYKDFREVGDYNEFLGELEAGFKKADRNAS